MTVEQEPSPPDVRAQPLVIRAAARERTGWFDLARAVAILAVVVVHETGVGMGFRHDGDPATTAWWAAVVLDSSVRWCVPVFLMVSGALLLDPRRTERPRDFYRKRLSKIGIPLVVWTAVYLVFRSTYLGQHLTPKQAAQAVAVGAPFLQMYFLYVIGGLYLLTPFLRLVVRHATHRMQAAFVALLLGMGALDQALSVFLQTGGPSAATRFLPYTGYFVAGWLLRDIPLTRRLVRSCAVLFVLAVAVTAVLIGLAGEWEGWGTTGQYLFAYLSPPVIAMSLPAFMLLRYAGRRIVPGSRSARTWSTLSGLSFGVYLVHPLFFFPLQKAYPTPPAVAGYLWTTLWHVTVIMLASMAVTWVVLKIPVLRRTV